MTIKPELRRIYDGAKERCNNPKHISYPLYGGRGIKFLFESFEQFKDSLGTRPLGYTLDRIDNNGNYEPNNVKWSSPKEQCLTRRSKIGSSGLSGVSIRNPTKSHKYIRYIAIATKVELLYIGKDFFEACCARKSWEWQNKN